MEKPNDSTVPTAIEIAKLVKDAEGIARKLATWAVHLTPEKRRQTLKFRFGGERIVDLVGDLATRHALSLPRISVDAMTADLELAERLAPLASALEAVLRTVSDTMLTARSECWWAATAYYTVLSRMTDSDPQLRDAMRPAVEFFAIGKRAPKPAAVRDQ